MTRTTSTKNVNDFAMFGPRNSLQICGVRPTYRTKSDNAAGFNRDPATVRKASAVRIGAFPMKIRMV